jgi:hypothetical protein
VLPVSRFLPWHLLALFPGFREPDRYCLLPAFDLATFSSSPAFRSATIVTSHLTFDVAAGAARILPLSFLSHSLPLDLSKNCANRLTVWCAGGCNFSRDNCLRFRRKGQGTESVIAHLLNRPTDKCFSRALGGTS